MRGYAFAIILGIVAAIWISERRWEARGGTRGEIADLAVWAVPFGLVGGRIYHVATDPDRYFGADGSLWEILYVWRGGLGVWGAIAMGALGVVIGCRLQRHPGPARSSTRWLPACWSPRRSGAGATGSTRSCSASPPTCRGASRSTSSTARRQYVDQATFHPTFLYESCGACSAFAFVVWADRRWKLGHGRVLALYVMAYTLGRGWIEMLRIDTVQLSDVAGLRLNVWTSIVLFVLAAAWFVYAGRRWPEREESVYTSAPPAETESPAEEPL